jgi:hypothetical protein
MRKTKLTLTIFIIIGLSTLAFADMVKGNVGGGGTKRYAFIASGSGQASITLIYDNKSSDLDLAAATSIQGQTFILGMDVSSQKNFARLEFGIVSSMVVAFIVDSYRGGSPYHVFVSYSEGESVRPVSAVEIRSDMTTEDAIRQLRKLQTAKQ